MHDRLLCNKNRFKRKLTNDPSCHRCSSGSEESLLHLLRECVIARNVSRSVGGPALYPSFFLRDLHTWIIKNLKAEGLLLAEKWPTLFSLTIWWIWKWRNCAIFGRNEEIPVDMGDFLHAKAIETWRAMRLGQGWTQGINGCPRREILL